MAPLIIIACTGFVALLAVAFVAHRAIEAADAVNRRDYELIRSMADRLQAGTLDNFKANEETDDDVVVEDLPLSATIADPVLRGIEEMRESGLDPDDPDHVEKQVGGEKGRDDRDIFFLPDEVAGVSSRKPEHAARADEAPAREAAA